MAAHFLLYVCVGKYIVAYLNETASLGKLNSAKDVESIPVKNQWCIKSQRCFNDYTSKGNVFFVIYLPNEPLPFTFVVAAICDGDVEYYDTQDSDHEQYQRKLPQEIVSYLYGIAAQQAGQKEAI